MNVPFIDVLDAQEAVQQRAGYHAAANPASTATGDHPLRPRWPARAARAAAERPRFRFSIAPLTSLAAITHTT